MKSAPVAKPTAPTPSVGDAAQAVAPLQVVDPKDFFPRYQHGQRLIKSLLPQISAAIQCLDQCKHIETNLGAKVNSGLSIVAKQYTVREQGHYCENFALSHEHSLECSCKASQTVIAPQSIRSVITSDFNANHLVLKCLFPCMGMQAGAHRQDHTAKVHVFCFPIGISSSYISFRTKLFDIGALRANYQLKDNEEEVLVRSFWNPEDAFDAALDRNVAGDIITQYRTTKEEAKEYHQCITASKSANRFLFPLH